MSDDGLRPAELEQARNDVRGVLVQGLGGAVLLVGLFFTARSFRAAQTSQITERFSHAVGHLGSREVSQRIGALYALERIAADSRQDYGSVIEILLRLIRERTASTEHRSPYDATSETVGEDVKVAVVMLGRRQRRHEERSRLAFRETVLVDVRFEGNYDAADFCYADLDRAGFARCSLVKAHFGWASLHGAFLTAADLRDATFTNAHLEGAYLRSSDLTGVDFTNANLEGGAFDGPQTRLSGANFHKAQLKGADFRGVDLREAVGLTRAQIRDAITDARTQLPNLTR